MSDAGSKAKGLMWLMLACAVGALLALGLSPLAHAIPWNWEKKLAYALDTDFSIRQCPYNPQAEALLQRLVNRLYPLEPSDSAFSIEVRVAKDPVVNAYAALGGQITINSGLLQQAESADEVAGVLAHEIGHVQHRHIMEGTMMHMLTAGGISMIFGGSSSSAQWTQYFLTMDFTRAQEAQADKAGLERLQKAHVDNQGFRHFFERMEKSASVPAFISDHPSNHSRSEMAKTFDNRDTTPIMTPQEWNILQKYCSE